MQSQLCLLRNKPHQVQCNLLPGKCVDGGLKVQRERCFPARLLKTIPNHLPAVSHSARLEIWARWTFEKISNSQALASDAEATDHWIKHGKHDSEWDSWILWHAGACPSLCHIGIYGWYQALEESIMQAFWWIFIFFSIKLSQWSYWVHNLTPSALLFYIFLVSHVPIALNWLKEINGLK